MTARAALKAVPVRCAPTAPRHLSEASRVLWRSVVADFELEVHHPQILTAACEARDRMDEARAAIERDGA